MPDIIKDGSGQGYSAKVNKNNRLTVVAKSQTLQHLLSQDTQQAYQVIGVATLAAATVVCLHVNNTSTDKNLVATYVRHQIVDHSGGTALPNVSNYFRIALNRTYSAGGSTATPVNVYAGSGNTAEVTAYQGGPTLTGTAAEIDRWYTKAEADMNTFSKEGALIVPPNGTIELAYVGDQTGGTIYSRLSFLMEERGL